PPTGNTEVAELSRRYKPTPTINFIEPTSGWIRGGTEITVHGSRMAFTQSIECVFGNATAYATFISAGKLVCTSP
ncbi:hypothetical protein PHYSODRAFT_434895, partial [Phytophthora sojae]